MIARTPICAPRIPSDVSVRNQVGDKDIGRAETPKIEEQHQAASRNRSQHSSIKALLLLFLIANLFSSVEQRKTT
jgi:hypothetical protein